MKHWLSKEEYRGIYSKVPRLNVEIVINTAQGIVLALRDIEPWKDQWHLPGGRVHMNETIEEAVKRIARAEVGVSVQVGNLLGYIEYPSIKNQPNTFEWPIGLAFAATTKQTNFKGGIHGRRVECFHELPENTIADQRTFLESHNLVR